jgi:cysteine-rich repeat protein
MLRTVSVLWVLALAAPIVLAQQRYRHFCGSGLCGQDRACGRANQPTCESAPACDSGFNIWDIPNQTVDCNGGFPCWNDDETITHGCYDLSNPPDCSLCGGNGQAPCPDTPICDPGCDPGYNLAGSLCYAPGCGGAGELPCGNGRCIDGIELQAGVCVDCGGNKEPECLFGDACRYGTRSLGWREDLAWRVCAYCGGSNVPGDSAVIACEGGACDPGFLHATTVGLDGPISKCESLLPGTQEQQAEVQHFIEQNGICSPGLPEPMTRTAPESWPAGEELATGRGTIVVIHGRGADCGPTRERMLDFGNIPQDGGLYDSGHLVYCVEYAQCETCGEPERLRVRVLPVLDDVLGNPDPPCTADDSCEFDDAHPVADLYAPSFGVPGVAEALKDALLAIPTVGDVTLMGHSQGGFVARELVYRHYDELRWHGRRIGRVISLAHPHYGKHVDPHEYTPWLCADRDDFDCATAKWLWGWSENVLGTPGSIDDSDYPQIEWAAVSGTGPAGNTSPEPESDACLQIFGGWDRADVAGDSSVPIQSSLGYEEFGFPFPRTSLDFDRRYHTLCSHTASCLIAEPWLAPAACVADGATPPPPPGTCWGEDPYPSLLPDAPPRPAPDALQLDGVDDHVTIDDPAAVAALHVNGALTIDAWVYPTGPGDPSVGGVIVSKEGEYWLGRWGDGRLAWALADGNWVARVSSYTLPEREWAHVAFTYDGAAGLAKLLVNGLLVQQWSAGASIGDVDPASNNLEIGRRAGGSQPFDGRLDEVRVWSTALSAHDVVTVAGGAAAAGPGVDPVVWYRFDEQGDTIADASGNGFDGSISSPGGAATPIRQRTERPSASGGAMYFEAGRFLGVAEPSHLAALAMDDELTIEAWIFPRGPGSPGAGGTIVNKEGEYALTRWDDGRLTWALANATPGWTSIQSTYVAPQHAWTHVAFVYDGPAQQARLYVNGALHQSWPASGGIGDFHPAENELRIGGRQHALQSFHGVIDEVRVWNRARTSAEIATDHATVIADPTAAAGLVAYFRLDEGAGGVAVDLASGHSATLGQNSAGLAPFRTWAPHLPGYALDYLACGDGVVDPLEGCDDGGTASADGCSPACRVEHVLTLHGRPAGGSISLVVGGVAIEVATLVGQTDQDVLDALAAAIAADPTLAAMGIGAVRVGNELFIGGSVSGTTIADAGLSDCTAGPSVPIVAGVITNTCPETSVTLSTGAYERYEWSYEGRPIPGASGSSYVATLTGSYGVIVRDAYGCPASSSPAMAFVGFCPDSELSPPGAIFPLRIEKSAGSSTGYHAYFQKLDDVLGYNLYSGTLGTWFDHGGGGDDGCGVAFTDFGTGELRAELPPSASASAYYLVTGFDGAQEGVAHTATDGGRSDSVQDTCLP